MICPSLQRPYLLARRTVPVLGEKHFMVMRHGLKKKYFLISAKLKEQVGALADLTKILAIRGIDVLEGRIHVSGAREGYVTLFLEAANPRVDVDFLKQMLSNSSFVESLTVTESRNGMIVDSVDFPLVTGDSRRSIVVTADSAQDFFSRAIDRWGKNAEDMVYQLGVDYGADAWSGTTVGSVSDGESLQEYLQLYAAIGMGMVFVEKFRQGVPSIEVSVERLFECEGIESSSPRSVFFRGVLAGTASLLFGREMVAREVACAAAGAKRCRFEISPKE